MNDFLSRIEKLSPKRLALLAYELQTRLERAEQQLTEPIAIVGLGCRFPGAPNPEAYWQLLERGVDAVREVPRDRWDIDAFFDPDPDVPGRMASRWGGFLDSADLFDAPFFGISRREAVSMDPQQRLLLEVAWEALEHAGQSPRALAGSSTGVFVGLSTGDFFGLLRTRGLNAIDAYTATGSAHSVAGGRVAYVLNLQGPNVSIDTACSSSLVAIHLACQSLRTRECNLALAGGVNMILTPDITVALSKSHMMAPDGHCKAFDASADGFVRGEGCGIIVLKRLSDAQANGDNVLAVIHGSAINQDGRSSGITAPNGASQQQVIRQALASARIEPGDVGYIEAHGTGTSLGDPIEAHALAAEFGRGERATPLIVGSVKANFGHLEAAAGVAGVIKTTLALQHGHIPPQLHFRQMNPHIDWGRLSVDIPVGGRAWPRSERPRLAGVSSFGFSGTNAHIILGEAPAPQAAEPVAERPRQILALSARTEAALDAQIISYEAALQEFRGNLGDFCFTANTGRTHFTERAAFVAASQGEMLAALRNTPTTRGSSEGRPKIAFLFAGQGAQWTGMGRELYDHEPVFREALDQCAAGLSAYLDRPLLDILYGTDHALLHETAYTQPAIFALEWSLAQLWKSWGIEPAVVLGHSFGEYAALCVAGVWTLDEGLRIIAERGKLTQGLPSGWGMTSVQGSLAQVNAALRGLEQWVSIAAVNAPESTVVSGRAAELDTMERVLTAERIEFKRLPISHAFHSAQMNDVAKTFAQFVCGIEARAPQIAVVSSVTGRPLTLGEIRDPDYWRRQVSERVEFQDAIESVVSTGHDTFLEIGPSTTLIALGRQCVEREQDLWVPSLRKDRGAEQQMLESLAALYTRGVEVDWAAYDAPYAQRRVVLPTYPFQRQRYWPDGLSASGAALQPVAGHAMLHGRVPVAVPVYQAQIDIEGFPFLADHRVGETAVLPGSVFIELALAAGTNAFGHDVALRDLVLREPMYLDAGSHTAQVVLSGDRLGETTVQVLGRLDANDDAPWTVHASGTLAATSPVSVPSLDTVRQGVTHPVSPDDFYSALRDRGIDLGERCRGMHALWHGDKEMLAEVVLDPAVADEHAAYRIHPILLDACLQVFGAALWRTATDDETRVLSRIGTFQCDGVPTARVWCHATLHEDGQSGTIDIYDDAGQLIAQARGLETQAIGASAEAHRAQPVDDWFYELAWKPNTPETPLALGSVLDTSTLPDALQRQASDLYVQRGLGRYAEMQPMLDRLTAIYTAQALQEISCPLTPGSSFTTTDCIARGQVVPAHHRLFERLLSILQEDGILQRRGETWAVISTPETTPDSIASDLRGRYSEFDAELSLTIRCASQLAGVLQGRVDPLQLLFPNGSVDALEGLYTQSPSANVFNPLIRQAVVDAVAAAPADRTVRILEIGAGTGGTTAFVAPALPPERVEYVFTDVSPLFLARAEERFGQYPFMRYETLDIEAETPSRDQYDIVIAANVLHATADLRETVRHARERLAPGGLLVLLEGTRPERWVDLTFGMTDGWWRFTDRDLRPNYPLLDQAGWHTVLDETGFVVVSAIQPSQGAQQVVLLAQASAAEPVGRWLIATEHASLGMTLARQVTTMGGTATHAGRDTLAAALADADAYDHIVDLRGIDIPAAVDAATLTTSETAANDLLDTMRVVADRSPTSRLWIVTRNAQAVTGPDRDIAATQAPLWGLGRAFALEFPDTWGGLIDVDAKTTASELAELVIRTVLRVSDEDQYAIRKGQLYVPRIERRTAPVPHTPTFSSTGAYLVTGGLGNIGLRLAEWLVEHGARHVILNGRHGVPDRDVWSTLDTKTPEFRRVQTIQRLESHGARVDVITMDLTRPDAADHVDALRANTELRGIFHAAAVFGSEPIATLDAEKLRTVLHPKTFGTSALSRLARTPGLECFVLFSSTTSLLGSRGMASYTASNQFLDNFAQQLRAEGVPALAVNWGTWDELGDISAETRANYIRGGLYPMPFADALDALGRALLTGSANLAIAQIDWTALKTVYETRRRRPILRDVANRTITTPSSTDTSGAPRDSAADRLALLATQPEADRLRALVDLIRNEAAAVLALRPDEVDPHVGLFEMGMDSLMSVELRARLARTFARKLPSTLTFNYPTVNALAAYLSALVAKPTGSSTPAAATPTAPIATPPSTASHTVSADASEDELAALLSNALDSID